MDLEMCIGKLLFEAQPSQNKIRAVHSLIVLSLTVMTSWCSRERVCLQLHDDSDPSQTVLNLLIAKKNDIPASSILPVVCVLHSTARSCETEEMLTVKARFARIGFLAVGLNSRYHGCRRGDSGDGKERYMRELVGAWKENGGKQIEGHRYPFIYDTAADLSSVADYLLSRPDVQRGRLGITGKSLGGMHAWFAASSDDRWTAVAPLIGVQSFSYAVEEECYHARVESIQDVFDAAAEDMGETLVTPDVVQAVWKRICPGLLEDFDAPRTLGSLSPRPVFIGNGELDPRCPLAGVVDAVRIARKAYQTDCGEPERLELHVYDGVGHQVTAEMWDDCLDFFQRVFPEEELCSTETAEVRVAKSLPTGL